MGLAAQEQGTPCYRYKEFYVVETNKRPTPTTGRSVVTELGEAVTITHASAISLIHSMRRKRPKDITPQQRQYPLYVRRSPVNG